MTAFRSRALRLLGAAAVGIAVIVVPAVGGTSSVTNEAKTCPRGMMPNPTGYYGCVPQRVGGNQVGGNPVGAPTQEMLSFCNGGGYWSCVWPYGGWS